MKRIRRAILGTVAAIGVGVCLVVGGGIAWIHSNSARAWLLERINASIPGTLAIGGHRLSILDPHLELLDVVLHDPSGLAVAGITRLEVAVGWWPLLQREIHVARFLLEAPWLDLAIGPDGTPNLLASLTGTKNGDAPKDTDTGGIGFPFNIVCAMARLSDGRFTFRPAESPPLVSIDGISLNAAGDLMSRRVDLDLELTGLRLAAASIHPPTAHFLLKAGLAGNTLTVHRADLVAGLTHLELTGSMAAPFAAGRMDIQASLSSELAALATAFGQSSDTGGALKAQVAISGRPDNPDITLVADVADGRVAGVAVDQGDLRLRLADRQIAIDHAALQQDGGTIRLNGTIDLRRTFPDGFLEPPANPDATAYDLVVEADVPKLEPWLEAAAGIGGRSRGRLTVAGRGIFLSTMTTRLALTGSGQGLVAPGMMRPVDAEATLVAEVNGGTIAIDRLELTSDGIHLSGDGHYRLVDHGLDGRMDMTVSDLSSSLATAGVAALNGSGRAALTIGGTLQQPWFTANLVARGLRSRAVSLGDVTLDARMTPEGRIDVTTLTLDNHDSRIRGNGRLRLLPGGRLDPAFDNSLQLHLERLAAADFMAAPPIHGRIDGNLRIGGPLTALTGELTLDAHALEGQGITLGDLSTALRLADGRVSIDRLDVNNQRSRVSAGGYLQLLSPGSLHPQADPAVDLTVASTHFDPADFFAGAVSGPLTLDGRFSGSLMRPVGRFTIGGRRIDLAGQAVEQVAMDGRIADSRLWIDRLDAQLAPGESVRINGSVGLDRTLTLSVESDPIPVSRIDRLHDLFHGSGRLVLDATAGGVLENPAINGRVTVSEVMINDQTLDDIHLDFNLDDMRARLNGRLDFAIDATGDLRSGAVDALLVFERTEMGGYFKIAGQPDLHGTLTGQIRAAGNIRDIANARVEADLSAIRLLHRDVELFRSDRVELQMVDRRITIPGIVLTMLSAGHARIGGKADLDGPIDLAVDARLPLTALQPFSEDLADIAGTVAVQGGVSGRLNAPRIEGAVDLEAISMTLAGQAQRLSDLSGRIALDDNRIRIERLTGRLDSGTFNLTGTVDHEWFRPTVVDMALQARALPLALTDTLSARVNADIRLTGSNRVADLNGELILLEGLYEQDVKINLLQMVVTRQRRIQPETAPAAVPFFDTIGLNVTVGYRQPFVVDNNLAQLEVTPDLKIGGSLARPVISGRAQVKNGTVTFQKKAFEVKKGIIDFVNPYKTEAEIDIESQATIASWVVTLAIRGTPDNLDLRLSSVPSESDADILSIILFGKTSDQLAAGGGGTGQTTTQIMAEMLADTFGEDIRKHTGVDILEVEAVNDSGTDERPEEAAGVKVTVGKHLSERLTVKYAIETKAGEVIQRAISEYQLLENILVSGFQDTQGVYGTELVFRIEFR